MPGSCTMFMCRPCSRQRLVTSAQLVGTAFGLVVDDQFEAGQQAAVRPAQTTRPSRDPGDPDLDAITRRFSLWRS